MTPSTFSSDVVPKQVKTTTAAMTAAHLNRILLSSSCELNVSSVMLSKSILMISALPPDLAVQVLRPGIQHRITNRLNYRHEGDNKG